MANGGKNGSGLVSAVAQLLGLATGIVALLYVAGGAVLALRLYLADLPSRTIAAQLPRGLLISIALAQIVLPVPVVAGPRWWRCSRLPWATFGKVPRGWRGCSGSRSSRRQARTRQRRRAGGG